MTLYWQNKDDDRRRQWHGEDCRQGMMAQCGRARKETRECPVEIEFSLKPVASGIHGIMADMF